MKFKEKSLEELENIVVDKENNVKKVKENL